MTQRHLGQGATVATRSEDEPAAAQPAVSPGLVGVLTVLLGLAATAAAAVSGLSYVQGNRTFVVLPLVLMGALTVGIVAITRFSWFVLLLLAIRPSIDLIKLSGASAGTAAGNTAAARGLDPSSIIAVLFLLMALLWLAARHFSQHSVRPSRLGIALGVFVLGGVLSVIGSTQHQASALEALRVATVAMMFLVLEQLITSRARMIQVLIACFVGLVYPLLYTTFGIVTGNPSSDVKGSFTRLSGPFSQSNTFSRYLAFMVVMGIALYPYVVKRWRWLLGGMTLLASVYMILTLTRTAAIGALAGIVVIAIVERRRGLLLGLVLGSLAALALLPGVWDRFATLEAEAEAGGGPSGNTLEWRLRYWTEVLPLANRNPITGIGLAVTQFETNVAKQPHNDFVRAYVEMGLVGIIAFASMLVALMGNARRALTRAPRGTLERGVSAGALGAATALILECAAANVMSNVVSLWYLAAFAACATYVARTHAGSSPLGVG